MRVFNGVEYVLVHTPLYRVETDKKNREYLVAVEVIVSHRFENRGGKAVVPREYDYQELSTTKVKSKATEVVATKKKETNDAERSINKQFFDDFIPSDRSAYPSLVASELTLNWDMGDKEGYIKIKTSHTRTCSVLSSLIEQENLAFHVPREPLREILKKCSGFNVNMAAQAKWMQANFV